MTGCFITFEGGEGGGKTTQVKLLAEKLASLSIPHHITREPGGTILAEKVRALLVKHADEEWQPEAEMLLFMAARVEHYDKIIHPKLMEGHIVICDRFHDSSRVYQGIARGLGLAYYERLHQLMLGDVKPHLTFLLDIPAETGLMRAAVRKGTETRFEDMGLAFHQQLREGFLAIASQEPQRFRIIDALSDPLVIHEKIWKEVASWM